MSVKVTHVSIGDEGTEVRRLTTVNASDQHEPREQRGAEASSDTEPIGKGGHHGVAEDEAHQNGIGPLENVHEILGAEGDPHGEHEHRQSPGKIPEERCQGDLMVSSNRGIAEEREIERKENSSNRKKTPAV